LNSCTRLLCLKNVSNTALSASGLDSIFLIPIPVGQIATRPFPSM